MIVKPLTINIPFQEETIGGNEKTIHEWAMPKELLSGGGDACREQLLNLGAKIYFKDKLSTFLMTAEPEARALCTESIGWHGNLNRPVCTRQFQAS